VRCYFLHNRRIAGVEILPAGVSDEEAIARAQALAAKRKGPLDSFEVWEGGRLVFRGPLADATDPPPPSDEDAPDLTRSPRV
jgi:hypothetical protein